MTRTHTCLALSLAAPASGQGKTTTASALARPLFRSGKRVRVFECAPDFLGPLWLALTSNQTVDQLNLWMTGRADCAQRLYDAALDANLIITDCVMGLIDGKPSAADLAQHFGFPDAALLPCDALWLSGGYPELHAETIAANAAMRPSVVTHVAVGKPLWAKCGDRMALFEWGVLRGHAFHYSTCQTNLPALARTQSACFEAVARRCRRSRRWCRSKPAVFMRALRLARTLRRACF